MTVVITKFVTGPIETNTYVISNDAKACCIVDPSSGCDSVLDWVEENAPVVEAVVLTHGHFDHILGVPEVLDRFPDITVWVHPADKDLLTRATHNGSFMIGQEFAFKGGTHDLKEGVMRIGSFEFTVLHVPGHTPGGCALIIDGNCLSGDALFAGSIGRSDFEYGDGELLVNVIREKLLTLPDTTVVYPGHGNRTTIGREKRLNPFFN